MLTQNLTSMLHQLFADVAEARFMSEEAAATLPRSTEEGATLVQAAFQAAEVDLAQRVRDVGEW